MSVYYWRERTYPIIQVNTACHPQLLSVTLIKAIEERWPRVKLKLQWVLGHEGIEGNEKADTEAKRAAEGKHRNCRHKHHRLLKGLPASKTATKQHLKRKVWKAHIKEFRKSPRYERMTKFDPKSPASNFMKIAAKLSRQQASTLIQLCSGHTPLQAYLHHFKLVDSPICPSCEIEPETVTHYLMYCVSYIAQRRHLRHTLGRDQSLSLEILGDEKRIKHLMEYINNMKWFIDTHGDLQHAESWKPMLTKTDANNQQTLDTHPPFSLSALPLFHLIYTPPHLPSLPPYLTLPHHNLP